MFNVKVCNALTHYYASNEQPALVLKSFSAIY